MFANGWAAPQNGWGAAASAPAGYPDPNAAAYAAAAGGWGAAPAAPAPAAAGPALGRLAAGASSTTVCVTGLPDEITPKEFRLMFKFAAGVERCLLNFSVKTGHPAGYARFGTLAEAQQVIDYLNGYPLDEDFLNPLKAFLSSTQLNDAPAAPRAPAMAPAAAAMAPWGAPEAAMVPWGALAPWGAPAAPGFGAFPAPGGKGGKGYKGGAPGGDPSTSVYVGGVPHEWDEGALASLFAGVGTVTNLAFGPAKSPIGKIAFVHFGSPGEAQAAIAGLNGYAIGDGRVLAVRPNTSGGGAR